MARVEEYAEESEFNFEDFINNYSEEILGKKQIKLNDTYLSYLEDPYFEISKLNFLVKNAINRIQNLEDDIINPELNRQDREKILDDYTKDIKRIKKFLNKEKLSSEKKEQLSVLLIQAETILELEKYLEDNKGENTIDENKKASLINKIELGIFSNDVKKYYKSKINTLVSYSKEDENLAQNLESEYENDMENIENLEEELKDDFDAEEEVTEDKKEVSNLSRFVKFSKNRLDKLKRGKWYTIITKSEELEKLLSGENGKHVLSDELIEKYDELQNLFNKWSSSKKVKPTSREKLKGRLDNINKKIEAIIKKEKDAEKAAEKDLETQKMFDKMMFNVRKKANLKNVNVTKAFIEKNKHNKNLFENDDIITNYLEEIDELYKDYSNNIVSKLDDKINDLSSDLNVPAIDETMKYINEEEVSDILKNLNVHDKYVEKVKKLFIAFIEKEITNVISTDNEKMREAKIGALRTIILNHKEYFENEKQCNEYLDKLRNIKINKNTVEETLTNKLESLSANFDDLDAKKIIQLHKEISANEDKLNKDFIKDLRIKLDDLMIALFEENIKFIDEYHTVKLEELEKIRDNVNTYINDYASNESVSSLKEIENKFNQFIAFFNKTGVIDDIKIKLDNLSLNPTYIGIKSLYDEIETNKNNLTELFSRDANKKLTELYENLVNKDFKQIELSPSVKSIEELLNNMDSVNIYLSNSLEIKEKLNQMKEELNRKTNEEQIIKEILKDVENAMNIARNNPTKENIDKARDEINKKLFTKNLDSNVIDNLYSKILEIDKLANVDISKIEKKCEIYDKFISDNTVKLNRLDEELWKVKAEIHELEGQFIVPEQKDAKRFELEKKINSIKADMDAIKEKIIRAETLKKVAMYEYESLQREQKNNYYDDFFKGVSHLTDAQLAEGIKQNMSYEELAEISKNLEKAEKLTPTATEPTISKEDVSESAYENITNSISTALQTRLTNPEEAKQLIDKANSIFNQNYFVYSEQQRDTLNEYIQTATNMIDAEIYKNSGNILK